MRIFFVWGKKHDPNEAVTSWESSEYFMRVIINSKHNTHIGSAKAVDYHTWIIYKDAGSYSLEDIEYV